MKVPPALPVCPACGITYRSVGPRSFPRITCACGAVLVWGNVLTKDGPGPAILIPENVHDTAPEVVGEIAPSVGGKVPTEYHSNMLPTGQVSRKIDPARGAEGSKPSSGAPSNPASLADLAPAPSGLPPKSTSPVPAPDRTPVPGAPLCAACHGLWGEVVSGKTGVGDLADCRGCDSPTRFLFTPVVLPAVTVAPPRSRLIVGPRDPLCPDCAAERGMVRGELEHTPAPRAMMCAACGESTWYRVPAPPAADVGQPFGVEIAPMAEAPERWQCSVRDGRGLVAYISIAQLTEDAARWAALSWLRGYARDVKNEDAEALRGAFARESFKTEAPANGSPLDAAASVPVPERNDDPVVALFAVRGIGEALRDRLIVWLKGRERAWELLAEDADAEAYTVALAKDRADCDLAEVFAALGRGA